MTAICNSTCGACWRQRALRRHYGFTEADIIYGAIIEEHCAECLRNARWLLHPYAGPYKQASPIWRSFPGAHMRLHVVDLQYLIFAKVWSVRVGAAFIHITQFRYPYLRMGAITLVFAVI